jgi:hypothetical protein
MKQAMDTIVSNKMEHLNEEEMQTYILSKLREMQQLDKENHETTIKAFEHVIEVIKLLDERITKLEER